MNEHKYGQNESNGWEPFALKTLRAKGPGKKIHEQPTRAHQIHNYDRASSFPEKDKSHFWDSQSCPLDQQQYFIFGTDSDSDSDSDGQFKPEDIDRRKPCYRRRKNKEERYQKNSHPHLCTYVKQCLVEKGADQKLFSEIKKEGTKKKLESIFRKPELQKIIQELFDSNIAILEQKIKGSKTNEEQKKYDLNLWRIYRRKFKMGIFKPRAPE